MVREYNSLKYLSMPREGGTILTDDIGDVEEIPSESESEFQQLFLLNAQIIGVPSLDSYKACIRCKARVEPQSPPLGRCSKTVCAMLQRYDFCSEQLSAKIIFQHGIEGRMESLHAFGRTVTDLADDAEGEQVTSTPR